MRRQTLAVLIILLQTCALSAPLLAQQKRQPKPARKPTAAPQLPPAQAVRAEEMEDDDPDLPPGVKIDKGEYRRLRDEQINLLRGFPYPKDDARIQAIYETMRAENRLRAANGGLRAATGANWRALGPAPIPNGQTTNRTDPVSGRATSIAVHPSNPNIVYIGTAQGGLYRTLDGGANWTPMLDNALSLAIGSVAISPSDPSTVFVGTGESGYSLDSFFGVGIYRITNADSQNPVVAGPLRLNAAGADVFTGRAVSEIIVHPTNPNVIFASTTRGACGLGGCVGQPTPATGLYRSDNALDASPVFNKLTVTTANSGNRDVMDFVIEPDNPNNLVCWVVGAAAAGDGGIYRTTNAMSANPTFTQSYVGTLAGARGELALQKSGSNVTVVAATGDYPSGTTGQGKVIKSIDGGVTFPTQLTTYNNFCSPQCFYDIAVAFDPNDANKLYMGGSPALPFGRSTDGGVTNTNSSTGLHVDTHAITVAPSDTNTIYFASDGGIWKSTNAGVSWTSLNNTSLNSVQFQSLGLHPTDRNYLLGGTQDNGTQYFYPSGAQWIRTRGGDGGPALIDQNSTSPTQLTAYHTFFNATNSQIGFERADVTNTDGNPQWSPLLGCSGGVSNNGIACADPVLFYAPMVLGPGSPINTLYFGTNKLYRSDNRGTLMTAVSQALPGTNERISTIGIAPQNDNVRIVGSTLGKIYATANGSTTLNDITGPIPTRYVGRVMIDPNDQNTAYVALNGYGLAPGAHVWKTTNLNAATPTWTVAGNGIPDVPVNAFAIDPQFSNVLFAGTDIGVFRSTDGGATWQPFNDGLPRVAVFDMAIQKNFRILRIATHGRGIYETSIAASPSANVRSRADFDGDGISDLSVFRNGVWFVQNSTDGKFGGVNWGVPSDTIIPGDFDGDRKTDFVVYRPNDDASQPDAYILISGTSNFSGLSWGVPGDKPFVADFTADGKADLAVYRQSNNTWYVLPTGTGAPIVASIGSAGETPVVLDYDGDAKADLAMWNSTNGVWTIRQADGSIVTPQWGQAGDRIVPADYDNDNKDDLAIYRGVGQWWIRQSSNGQLKIVNWGLSDDAPVPADYDGDGADDVAVYRNGVWYIQTATSAQQTHSFGIASDKPVPASYIP